MYTFQRDPIDIEVAAGLTPDEEQLFKFEATKAYQQLIDYGTDPTRAMQLAASIGTKAISNELLSEAETNALLGLDCLNDTIDF